MSGINPRGSLGTRGSLSLYPEIKKGGRMGGIDEDSLGRVLLELTSSRWGVEAGNE